MQHRCVVPRKFSSTGRLARMHSSSPQQSGTSITQALSRCVAGALLCLLVACTSPAVITTSSVAPEQSVLAYFEWLQSASPEAIQTELNVLNRETRPLNPLQHDVKLVLVLSAQGRDDPAKEDEAYRLLENVNNSAARDNLPVDYRIFAAHWEGHLQQRRQVREFSNLQQNTELMLKQLEGTYHDLEQRYSRLSSVMNSLEKQNGLLDQQNKLMQQQLDALTVIEQQLVERELPQSQVPAPVAEAAE